MPARILFTLLFPVLVMHTGWSHHILPDGFVIEEITAELNRPTAMAFAPDGRIFIAEKGGAIRIIEDGILLPQPFYQVTTETPNERGLDGIALDPDFDRNHYVYLYYSIRDDRRNKLARVTAAGNTAIPDTEVELMRFGKMWGSWHNGGALVFGHDGKLYVSVGDGTAGVNAPKMDWLLGKVLRINPDGSIPDDNPLLDKTHGEHQSIYAYGIRNAYTMAISRGSGRIFFCDVGNNLYEEINELKPGANYGWNRVEGMLSTGSQPPDDAYIDPIYAYAHEGELCAAVGAAFYEPMDALFPPDYYGRFFFMDYCTGLVFSMDPQTYQVDTFAQGFDFPNNLAVGDDGSLYVMQLKTGQLFRISYVGSGEPFISSQPKGVPYAQGETAQFYTEALGDSVLTYQWFSDGQLLSTRENDGRLTISGLSLEDDGKTYYCLVSNYLGLVSSDTVTLQVVAGTRPELTILSPEPSLKFRAGQEIDFEVEGTDLEDGTLDGAAIRWEVNFHHDDHTHPAKDPVMGTKGTYQVGKVGEVDTNVFYRFEAHATDKQGLTGTSFVDIRPQLVQIELESDPSGITVSIDGAMHTTPYTLHSLDQQTRTFEAPVYDIIDQHFYAFTAWEDGSTDLIRTMDAKQEMGLRISYADSGFYHTSNGTAVQLRVYTGIGEDTVFYKTQRQHNIDANWDVQSPYRWDGGFPDDEYAVLYTGMLVPPITAEYTIYFLHDGYITFELGDSVLIDRLEDDSELTEPDSVTVFLEGGKAYPFQLFYEHLRYVARIQASWTYSVVRHQVIPEEHFQRYDPENDNNVNIEDSLFQLSVFPNPVQEGKLHFSVNNASAPSSMSVTVLDLQGRKLYSRDEPLIEGQAEVDIPHLVPGVYILEVQTPTGLQRQQFAVVR